MTTAIDTTGIESVLIIKVFWAGATTLYSDKVITAPIGSCIGKILQANVISKTGQIGQSGVSKTTSVTLDDTTLTLRGYYDSKVMEGTYCEVYLYVIQATPVQKLLMSGVISSDIKWNDGDRTLTFSIEGGTNQSGSSGELGYAPEEGAFATLNAAAIGKNWPTVFGTVAKVPAVRIEYYDNLKVDDFINYATSSFTITNGAQLPQAPNIIRLTIDGIIFEGTMLVDVFTPTSSNLPAVTSVAPEPRVVGDMHEFDSSVFWVPPGVNLERLYVYIKNAGGFYDTNYCELQADDKCYFSRPWFNGDLIGLTHVIEEAARHCRTLWTVMYVVVSDGGNTYQQQFPDKWCIYKGAPVFYNNGSDHMDRYVANLFPSTSVLAIWGKQTFNNQTRWAKVPKAYYHYHLNETITTSPGAVVRYCTVIDFPLALNSYRCENWENEIWVTLESTLPNLPNDIIDWVTTNFTAFTFDVTSDNPVVTMNFVYSETTDAIEFMKEIAHQSASAIQISGANLKLTFLAKTPVVAAHTITADHIIMKSLVWGFKPKEEINTIHKSIYFTDYLGEKTSQTIYQIEQNVSQYGVRKVENTLWALTCQTAAEAITDFWGVKTGNSWKTVSMACFLDMIDAEVYDVVDFGSIKGLITSIGYDTDRPCINVSVELAMKAASVVEDATYWTLATATCASPTDTELDYTPERDPKCPEWSYNFGQKTVRRQYHVVITKWPVKILRGVPFSLDLELHDDDENLVTESPTLTAKLYSTNNVDNYIAEGFNMVSGKATLTFILRRSLLMGRIHLSIRPNTDKRIKGGDVLTWRPAHI